MTKTWSMYGANGLGWESDIARCLGSAWSDNTDACEFFVDDSFGDVAETVASHIVREFPDDEPVHHLHGSLI